MYLHFKCVNRASKEYDGQNSDNDKVIKTLMKLENIS